MARDYATQSASGRPIKGFFDIDWKGDVANLLMSAAARLNKPEMLLRTIGRKLVVSMRRNIDESRSFDGTAFPPLKDPRDAGRKPLYKSGTMYDTLMYAPDNPIDEVSIGSPMLYSKYQQLGTGTIPPRPFIGIREGDIPDELLEKFAISAFAGDEEVNLDLL